MSARQNRAQNAPGSRQWLWDFNRAGEQFLSLELDLAHSLIWIGDATSNPQRRQWSYQQAAAGYRTVARFLPRLDLYQVELEWVHARLRRIRHCLRARGVPVEDVPRLQSAAG